MRKNQLWFVCLLAFVLASTSLSAQRNNRNSRNSGAVANAFQGTINYQITATGALAAMLQGQMPTGMEFSFLGKKMLMTIKGVPGGGDMVMLMDNETGDVYNIDHTARVVKKIKQPETPDTAEARPSFTPEGEPIELFGYTCKRYIGKLTNPMAGEIEMEYFVTDRIRPYSNPEVANRAGNSILDSGLDGFPLKFVQKLAAMDVQIAYTAIKVVTTAPDASLFTIPAGYTVEEVSADDMMQGGF